MEQSEQREQGMKTANQNGIYKLMLVGILIGIVGCYIRFAIDAWWWSLISWIILFIGAFIACKAVFKILDAK